MAIVTCTNAFAGKDQGYNPNHGSCGKELDTLHAELSHETTYEGCVLKLGEHNWHDDSDFFALVWDEATGTVKKIEYATTRGWTYHNHAKVDATPANRAKALAYETHRLSLLYIDQAKSAKLKELKELGTGMEVKSLTTRGKNKGVVGYVQVIKNNAYGPGEVAGIQVEGESSLRWIPVDRLERTDYPADEEALAQALCLDVEEMAWATRHARANAAAHLGC